MVSRAVPVFDHVMRQLIDGGMFLYFSAAAIIGHNTQDMYHRVEYNLQTMNGYIQINTTSNTSYVFVGLLLMSSKNYYNLFLTYVNSSFEVIISSLRAIL